MKLVKQNIMFNYLVEVCIMKENIMILITLSMK